MGINCAMMDYRDDGVRKQVQQRRAGTSYDFSGTFHHLTQYAGERFGIKQALQVSAGGSMLLG